MMPQTQIETAIDGRMLGASATGVATYAEALRDALRRLGGEPKILADRSSGGGLETADHIERWLRWLDVRYGRRRQILARGDDLWCRDIFRLAYVHFNTHGRLLSLSPPPGPPRIMHWTYPLAARIEGWINLYTIHDLIPIEQPMLSPIDGPRLEAMIRAIVASGGRLMTVSDDARASVARLLGDNGPPIFACPTGLDVTWNQAQASPAPKGCFVAVGSVEPRKNLARLAKAWSASGSKRPLVVVGPTGWQGEAIEKELAEAPGLIRIPHMQRSELLAAIGNARALLFPSLAEGFGLPIVEAMALGVPVAASSEGATGEVAGDAGLAIDPNDMFSIQAAIERLDRDDALCARLAAAGRERARHFTTDAFAARLAEVHRAILRDSEWRAR